MNYSLIIPCYNSEQHIQNSVCEIINYLDSINKSYEIILVDDNSSDKTWELLSRLKNVYSNLICIKHKKNFGQTVATNIGIYYSKGERIITMDDDLKYNLDTIAAMDSFSTKYNLIYGYIENKDIEHVFRLFFDFIAGKQLATSFRFISREIIPMNFFINEQLEIYFQKMKWIKINKLILPSQPYKIIPTRTNIFSKLKFIIFLLPNFSYNKLMHINLILILMFLTFLYFDLILIASLSMSLFIVVLILMRFKNRLNYFYNINNPEDAVEIVLY